MSFRPPSRSAASPSPFARSSSAAGAFSSRTRTHAETAAWVASATQPRQRERGPSRINPFSHRTQPFTPEPGAIEETKDADTNRQTQIQDDTKETATDDAVAADAPAGDAETTSAAAASLAASGGLVLPASSCATSVPPPSRAPRPPSPTLSEVSARASALCERLGGSRALAAARSAVESTVQFRRLEEQARLEDARALSHPWVRLQGNKETEGQYAPPPREQAHPLWGVPRPESRIAGSDAAAANAVSRAPSAISPSRKTPSAAADYFHTDTSLPESQLDELQDAEGDGWLLRAMHAQKTAFSRHLAPDLSLKLSRLSGEYNTRNPAETFLASIEGHSMTRATREYDPLRPEAPEGAHSAAHAALKAGKHYSRPTTSEGLRSNLGSRAAHTRPSTSHKQQVQTPATKATPKEAKSTPPTHRGAADALTVAESKEEQPTTAASVTPAQAVAAPFVPLLPASHLPSGSSAAVATASVPTTATVALDPSDPGFIDPAFAEEKLLTMTKAQRKAARRERKALRRPALASQEHASASTVSASSAPTPAPAIVQHFPHPPTGAPTPTLRSADARLVSSLFDDDTDDEKTAPHSQLGSQLSSAAASPRPPLARTFSPGRSILRHRTFLVAAGAIPAASAASVTAATAAAADVGAEASTEDAAAAAAAAVDVLSHPPSPTDRVHSVSWVHPLPRAPDASLSTTVAAAAEAHKRALELQAAEALRPPSPPPPPLTVEQRAAAKGLTAPATTPGASSKPHPPTARKGKTKQTAAAGSEAAPEEDSQEHKLESEDESRGAQTDRPRTAGFSTARTVSSQQRRASSGSSTSRPASSRATGANRPYVPRAGSRFAFSPPPIGPLSSFGYSERSCSAAGHTSQCIDVELQSGSGGSSAVPIDVMARPRSVAQSAHLLTHGGGCAVRYKSAKLSGQRDVLASVISDTLATGQVRQMAVRHFRRSVELITSTKAAKGVAALLEGSTSAGSSLALMRQKAATKRAATAAGGVSSSPGIADLTSAATRLREASAGVALTTRSYLSERSSSAAAAASDEVSSAVTGVGSGPGGLGPEVRIPARYTRILGTDIAEIPGALSFGEPCSSPFRAIASSSMGGPGGMGAAFRDARPECFDAAKYVGPGLYHPSHTLQTKRVPDAVHYGPPHSISVAISVALGAGALIPADRDPQGPGVHRPNYAATAAQGKALHGAVLFASTSGRGEGMAWRGIAPDLSNPGPKYDPAKHSRLWSDQLKHRYCEHGFGSGERFADTPGMQPPTSGHAHSYLSAHPEKLLELCGPRQGPGTLHTVIPSRTAHGRFPYDPNLGSYLESKHIVPLEEVGRYLSREEMGEGGTGAGSGEGGNGAPAHTRMMSTGGGSGGDGAARGGGGGQSEERITRDMEAMLAAALASAPVTTIGPSGPGGSRTFVPVQAPTRGPNMPAATAGETGGEGDAAAGAATEEDAAATTTADPSHYRDPHALPPPSQYELRARAALFAPPRRASYSPVRAPSSRRPNTGHIRPQGVGQGEDVTKRNKILARASYAGPEARHTKHDAALATSAAHREEVLARGARIHQSKIERLRQKMALADAQDSEGDGGRLWQQRWLVLTVLSRRAAWMKALLLFSRRMRSPAHLQSRAARKIQRFWRGWFLARQTARRAQAVATINRALGVFRIQLRIRHKRHAARVLALFFKDLAANNYAPPLQMQLKETAAAAAGAISGKDESALIALRAQRGRKAAQARFVARMKKRQGDRTLVGLIRHFKDQVIVIQRAWRAHLLLREFSIDMHALAWDRVVNEHFAALYRKQTSGLNATTLAANAAAALVGVGTGANGASSSAASQLYRSSSISKPPEQSAAFKAQRALIKANAEAKAEEAEREARQRADEIKFGLVPSSTPALAREASSSLPASGPTLVKQTSSRPGSSAGMPASGASIAAASSSTLPPASVPGVSTSLSHRSLSPPPVRVPKPLVLKLDCRFTVSEKRAILLTALRLRKLRFLRVKAHYESQIGAWVADQNQGISAARRLLECPPPVQSGGAAGHRRQLTASRFTPAFFAAKFTRIHPPPYLPRLMSGRQMIQLINAAAQAKRESKNRRQQQQRGGAAAAAAMSGAGEERASRDVDDVGRSVKQLFHSGPAAPAKLPSPGGSPPRSLNASPRASVSNLQRMASITGPVVAGAGAGAESAAPMFARTPSLARTPSMVRTPSLVRQPSKLGSDAKQQHGSPRISPRGSIIGSGSGSPGGSPSRGVAGESVEVRLRHALLRNWAAQLPIPTRRLRTSAAIAAEEDQLQAAAAPQPGPSIVVSPASAASAGPPHARQSSRGSHHSSSSFSAAPGHNRRQSSFDRSGGAIALAELLREAAELVDFAAEDDPNDAEIQVPAQLEQLQEEED